MADISVVIENVGPSIEVEMVDESPIIAVSVEGAGPPGPQGNDGVSPTVSTESVDGGTKIIITDAVGVKEFVVSDGKDGAAGQPGKDGADGQPGRDGVSPAANVQQTAEGATITVTDTNGTTTATITNGRDGAPGRDGVDGQPGADGPEGPAGADGYTPKRGVDYWTDADKREIVAATVAALPVYNGEVQDVG